MCDKGRNFRQGPRHFADFSEALTTEYLVSELNGDGSKCLELYFPPVVSERNLQIKHNHPYAITQSIS